MSVKTHEYGILGVGMYAPEGRMTNADLEKIVDTSDEWITSRTGIKERRVVAANQATSDMAVIAARRALDAAATKADEIDMIICCTFSPDVTVPCCGCVVQEKLGIAGRCPAFDLNAACTGFTYGLSIATAFLRAGVYKRVLVIGADTVTRSIDYRDRGTCVLFGDGAGAAVLGYSGPGRGFVSDFLSADGSLGETLVIHDSGSKRRTEGEKEQWPFGIFMNGSEVFKFATRALGNATQAALEAAGQGLTINDLDLLFPHQANLRIIEAAAKRIDLPMEKVFVNIHKYGNTSAASIPIALSEAVEEGRLKPGQLIGLVAFGGGLTYGSSIWVW